MRYYLDCEFDGFGGPLISLALVKEDGDTLYLVAQGDFGRDPWVAENVLPILDCPYQDRIPVGLFSRRIEAFMAGDEEPIVITDWPDDVRYFCQCLITGPGQMINIPNVVCLVLRVDAYPTDLPGAIQHNAAWDARALRHLVAKHGLSQ